MAKLTALNKGITGQDDSYLADFPLTQGYRVVGMVRRSSTENFERIEHLRGNGIRKKSNFSSYVPDSVPDSIMSDRQSDCN